MNAAPRLSRLALPGEPCGVDHVVLLADAAAATVAGLDVLRVLERDGRTYAYVKLGTALLEIVAGTGGAPGRWGVTFVAPDPSRAAPPRPAARPGRRIATFPRAAGLGLPVALISPRA